MRLILLAFLISVSTLANSSTWDLYRQIMERGEQEEGKIEDIPVWMLVETEREVSKPITTNQRSSFDAFIELSKGPGAVFLRGNDGPNGGDAYGSEFATIGFEIAKEIENQNITSIDLASFKKAIDEVIVYSDEGDYIAVAGQPVDALNFPRDKKILISRARWRQMVLKQKISLVFHEYLGIIDSERNVYKVSSKMNKLFDDLVSTLKSKQTQLYYGMCDANLPLSFQGEVCGVDNKFVKSAILCAKEQALKRCMVESYTECVGEVVIREERLEKFGLPSCRVTAIIK